MSVMSYDPSEWPFKWATYEQARGWVTRVRNGDSSKLIASELGVSWSSVKRATVWYLKSVGEYDPQTWGEHQRQRRAEGRRAFRALCDERDRKVKAENEALAAERQQRLDPERERLRDAFLEHRRVAELERAALAEPHVASTRNSVSDARERRRSLQRRLNARNRRYAGA